MKFNKLVKTLLGIGDPNMTDDVGEAKMIRRLIVEKSKGITGLDGIGIAFSSDDADDEDDIGRRPVENIPKSNRYHAFYLMISS